MNLENKKIAIVCDWLKDFGGAELVLSHILEIFPKADIFTSVFFMHGNEIFKGRKITTSFIQKIPFLNKSHKLALILRPFAFESFDLSEYDIVISSSSAESKGIITKPETIHICYCHTPTRYFWSHYHEYLGMAEFGFLNPIAKWLMPKIVHKLRMWDFLASKRVDYFIANSKNTKSRINKYYKSDSEVIYPGLDVNSIPFSEEKDDYYFYNGRCIPYKKFDLIVETFNKNGKNIIISTNTDNKLYRELKQKSKSNIIWKLGLSLQEINKIHSRSKAFLFPPEEDFGLVPIAAMASGTPVIAYNKGGATETIINGETGIFFENQSVRSLNNAIEKFEEMTFDYRKIREYAMKFDKEIFKQNLLNFINEKV
ncbi:MAG: glycosyltransferase [Candidatus Gracilibacteria bacterium]|nr:glycosyltransferase [Candidatus Gracilibacteria bacterium]